MTTALLLLAALALVLANGLFVAAEFALVTVERGEVERAANAGDRRSRSVLAAVRSLSFQLSGAQLGITVTSLVVGMLAEPALSRLLDAPLKALGLPAEAQHTVAYILGMVLASLFQMVIGELVPKNWAVSRPLQVARAVAGPQRLFSTVCRPLIALLNGSANRIVRAMGMRPADELGSARSAEELISLARHSAQAGALEEDTADLFVRTLGLEGLTAQSVMTPRVDVVAVQDRATAADVLNLARATGLSRFPVYREGIDEITGVVTLKQALAVPREERGERPVTPIAAPPLLVPESLPAERLLERLRRRQPMAVVVDEYGGTAGVVTLEDIVEEMVGSVQDEHDPEDLPELRTVAPVDGHPAWDAEGGCRVDQLASIGLHAPEGPYETVAGLVADLLGRLPAPGESAELPGWRLTVLDVERHRTERVRLVRTGAPEEPGRPAKPGEGAR
ncbi:hemolysin family protein [Phaeacidiphilus oryzae]|uniref:hemolysin family protein n=1 Tax=Phaeacidiphilus oryzae TaxID=348818 RepID=UPI0005644CAC|nr:hemolysin family protein [Phaeacidiphilus oryzae]